MIWYMLSPTSTEKKKTILFNYIGVNNYAQDAMRFRGIKAHSDESFSNFLYVFIFMVDGC